MTKVATPGKAKCEDVAALLGIPLERTVKSIVLAIDPTPAGPGGGGTGAGQDAGAARIVLVLLRGDHDLNEVKTRKLPIFRGGFRFATESEIVAHSARRQATSDRSARKSR